MQYCCIPYLIIPAVVNSWKTVAVFVGVAALISTVRRPVPVVALLATVLISGFGTRKILHGLL